MDEPLTFLVIVTGFAGKGMLSGNGPRALQSYLLQQFSDNAKSRVIVFPTIDISPGDNPPCAPNLADTALRLLRFLQDQKEQEYGEVDKRSEKSPQDAGHDEENHVSDPSFAERATGLQVIFLAHDIGGFVVNQALLLANSERCFQWIATGSIAALFFGTPQNVPENTRWDSIVVRMLAELDSKLDTLSFLTRFPESIAQIQKDFDVLLGSYHIINFSAHSRLRYQTMHQNFPEPIYRCDQHVLLDCDPDLMWDVGDEKPWSDAICQVIRSHIHLDTKGSHEICRRLTLSLARLHPDLHKLGEVTYASAPQNVITWITKRWCDERIRTCANPVCHVVGRRGAGKSIFTNKIVDNLRTNNRLVLSYAVCEESKKLLSPVDLFRSLCQQALLSPSTLHSATQVCSWLMDGALFTNDAFKGLLRSVLSSYTGDAIICIIDGFDHYSQDIQTKLLSDLDQVRQAAQTTVRIVLTRSHDDGQHSFNESDHIINVDEEIKASSELERLAEAHFKNLTVAKPVWGTVLPASIKKLWQGSGTLFELTGKLDFLTDCAPSTPQEAEKEVRAIPETFPLFFSYIEKSRGLVGSHSLFWIAHAVRPLTVSELAVCVAIEGRKSSEALTAAFLKRTIPWNLHELLEKRLGLILKITGQTVHINHRLTEEQIHLTASWYRENGHFRVLNGCLSYLKAISGTWDSNREFDREHRLVEYAVLHWPDHFRRAVAPPKGRFGAPNTEAACQSVLSLFEKDTYFDVWLRMLSYYAKAVPGRRPRLPNTRIQAACYFGLTTILEILLSNMESVDGLDIELGFALDLAVDNGHVDVVHLLVGRGIRSPSVLVRAARSGNIGNMDELLTTHKTYIDSRAGPDGVYTPLLQAARCGHLDIFTRLKQAGADITATSPKTNLTAVHLASRIGHDEIVELLIREDIPIGLTDQRGYTALAYASEAGFAGIVNMFIEAKRFSELPESATEERKQLINKQTCTNDTPLHLAAGNGHRKTVQILLHNQADLWIPNERGYTPLHCAAEGGFNKIIEDLLQAMTRTSKPDMDLTAGFQSAISDENVPSPLELAARSGRRDAIISISMYKEVTNTCPETLSRALEAACHTSNTDCILYLLQWNHKDRQQDGPLLFTGGETVFHLLARRGDAPLFRSVWKEMCISTVNGPESAITIHNEKGRTPLHEATISGRLCILEVLSEMLPEYEFEETTSDESRRTLLQLASEGGHVAIVNWLLKNEFLLSKSKEEMPVDNQAVLLAARNHHKNIVKMLLPSGYATASGQLLHSIVEHGWEEVVESALRKNESAVNWQDSTNRTALHIAVQKQRVQMIPLLLKAEADVNKKDQEGKTPFFLAMEVSDPEKNIELVECLLNGDPGRKMLVDEPDKHGVTPLLQACADCQDNMKKVDVLRCLLERRQGDVNLKATYQLHHSSDYAGKGALHLAALMLDRNKDGSDALLNLLLHHGADPNAKHARGSTPLFLAAETGHLRAVRLLIERGADTKTANNGGSTPLHRAAQNGYADCIEELVEHGADVNATKKIEEDGVWGITPLVLAASQSHQDAVQKLLDMNATVGRAFHFAGSVGIAEALLERYGDTSMQEHDKDLGSPLHSAIMSEDEELVNLFLSHGIDVNAIDGAGRTPLIIAAKRNCKAFVETLLTKDVNPNKRDHEGKTALDHAITSHYSLDITEFQDNSRIAELLCNHPTLELSGTTVRNHSPLYLATRMLDDEIFETVNSACKRLLENAQYVQMCELALHAAIASDRKDRLDDLLNVDGVAALVKDDDGWTPLYSAIRYCRSEMQETLRQKLNEVVADVEWDVEKASSEHVAVPTAWHFTDRHPSLFQPHEETERQAVRVVTTLPGTDIGGEENTAVVRADHCIPGDRDYYFEVTVTKGYKNEPQNMGIGLMDDMGSLNSMIGFSGLSYGYHADDGSTYATRSWSQNLNSSSSVYGEGDTVGCGFDVKNNRVYFTKEGERQDEYYDDVHGKLYPAVFFSTREVDVSVSSKFFDHGTGDFKYQWQSTTVQVEDAGEATGEAAGEAAANASNSESAMEL